ncbi:MAG: amino acid racemase [candidate division NC10 bacterium]|nr:amino acid racemase [candidate division NC10 bacterium]
MPTVGLIGGIAPESTIDYYRRIVALYRERRGNGDYPTIIINSINLNTMLRYVTAHQLRELTAYLLNEVARLGRAGADYGLLASNTPHIVFDDLSRQSPIPLISIVEATGAEASAQGFRTVGLLGTRFTMEGGFYSSVLARSGIEVVTPASAEREYVHDTYMGELVRAQFRPEMRARFTSLIQAMRARDAIDAVILGGTELPLLLRDAPDLPCPVLDTTAIHVQAVVDRLLELEGAA